jgi:hypothetical protein
MSNPMARLGTLRRCKKQGLSVLSRGWTHQRFGTPMIHVKFRASERLQQLVSTSIDFQGGPKEDKRQGTQHSGKLEELDHGHQAYSRTFFGLAPRRLRCNQSGQPKFLEALLHARAVPGAPC